MLILKKSDIMLIDFALAGQCYLSSEDPIHEAGPKRFRPIPMTTIRALLAGVPLIAIARTVLHSRQLIGMLGVVFGQFLRTSGRSLSLIAD